MSKRFLNWLAIAFVGFLLGGLVGGYYGERQLEQTWQRVALEPHSIQGDPGAYLCLMGYAPLYAGVLGAITGAIGILSLELIWLKCQKHKVVEL